MTETELSEAAARGSVLAGLSGGLPGAIEYGQEVGCLTPCRSGA
jgi:hypothetical protein